MKVQIINDCALCIFQHTEHTKYTVVFYAYFEAKNIKIKRWMKTLTGVFVTYSNE